MNTNDMETLSQTPTDAIDVSTTIRESVALDLQRAVLILHRIDDAWHGMESAAARRETETNWAFCDIANPSRPLTDVYAHIYQSHRLAIREALAELISMTEAAQ